MAFDLPVYHRNTHENITILVVDDDPIFLSIIPNMLRNQSYRDKSLGGITVMTANDSSEAVSTVRGQRNNIDVVVTDYHMPGLNGVQLKKKITEEFGNVPVIVISADMNNEIEQETLSSGAVCCMRKPIKPNDVNIICEHALNYKTNDGSKEIENTESTSNPDDGDSQPQVTKKYKIQWTTSLENHFCKAIQHIGIQKATPKKILEFMNLNYLTRAHVASKLQKYRKFLKRVKEEGVEKARKASISNLRSSRYINPQCSYNYNTSLSNNNPFNSQFGYGLGQSSRPMMNNNAGFHDSVNYMNRRPTYNLSQTRSNLLPRRGSIGFLNGMLPSKEERRSISGSSQESQTPKFGQYGTTSNVLGMNSNLNSGTIGSNYAGIRIDEKGNVVRLGEIRFKDNGDGSFGGIRVHGTGNGSLGGIRVYGTDTGSLGGTKVQSNGTGFLEGIGVYGDGNGNGSLGGTKIHGNGNGSLGGRRVYGTENDNDSLDGVIVHDNGNANGSLGGIRVYGTGTGSLGGTKVQSNGTGFLEGIGVHGDGNGNGSLGGIKIHGNGNGSFGARRVYDIEDDNDSLDGVIVHDNGNANGSLGGIRVHGTGNGSLDGIHVHVTSNGNPSLGENLGGMNWNFNNNTMSNHGSSTSRIPSPLSPFLDEDQSQNYLNARAGGVVPVQENTRVFNDHHSISEFFCDTRNSQFDQNQHQGKVTGENLEVSTACPLDEDISNWDFNNGNYNEETLNSLAANSEMYFPTDQDMNITNQEEHAVADLTELPLSFDQDSGDDDFMSFLFDHGMN